MRRTTIVRVFVSSLIALSAGVVLLSCALLATTYDDSLVMSGSDVIGFRFNEGGVAAVVIAGFSAVGVVAAAVLYVIAWIGALVNAVHLPEPDWFLVLLLTGILGAGLVGMAAYVFGAPDARADSGPAEFVDQEPRPVMRDHSPVSR